MWALLVEEYGLQGVNTILANMEAQIVLFAESESGMLSSLLELLVDFGVTKYPPLSNYLSSKL